MLRQRPNNLKEIRRYRSDRSPLRFGKRWNRNNPGIDLNSRSGRNPFGPGNSSNRSNPAGNRTNRDRRTYRTDHYWSSIGTRRPGVR